MNRIVAAIQAKSKNYAVRLGGVIANRSAGTDQIDRFNERVGLKTMARFPGSRRDPAQPAEEVDPVRNGTARPSSTRSRTNTCGWRRLLWDGVDPLLAEPMKDRDIFDLLGFD